jgi:hypothetical protein
MSIKWSALEVSDAMDEVKKLISQAEPFLAEAEAKAADALSIPRLPQYMEQRIGSLKVTIQRRESMTDSIETVRMNLPAGAVEAERHLKNQPAFI